MAEQKPGICGLCFHSPGCGVIVHFDDDGKIDRLTPDPGAPVKRSALALLDVNRDCLVIVGFVELMERRRRGLRDVYLF